MIVDAALLSGGITADIVAKLIEKHDSELGRYERLKKYYDGDHDILRRKKKSSDSSNETVVCNHAKYIVDMAQAYLIGEPVKYSASEEYDISPIDNAYLEQDIEGTDSELVKQMGIYGRAYELVYSEENANPRSAVLDPQNTFVVYSDDCSCIPLIGVYRFKHFDLSGVCTGTECRVYDSEYIYYFKGAAGSWHNMRLEKEEPHYFKKVPIIEYMNNAECQADFEQEISLIDAYNLLMSDRVNDKEQYVDSFLYISGMDVDSDQAKKLKEERILLGFEGGDAKYIYNSLSESDVKILRDDILEDIHSLSLVPALSDESFGNNLSGVAIKYKLLCFEQMTKNRERYFKRSLKRRFELYNAFFNVKQNMQIVPVHRIDIIFTRNLPVNNLETAQMLNYLDGIISQKTKLEQLDFVSDADEELEIFSAEQENKRKNTQALYGKPINNSYAE